MWEHSALLSPQEMDLHRSTAPINTVRRQVGEGPEEYSWKYTKRYNIRVFKKAKYKVWLVGIE